MFVEFQGGTRAFGVSDDINLKSMTEFLWNQGKTKLLGTEHATIGKAISGAFFESFKLLEAFTRESQALLRWDMVQCLTFQFTSEMLCQVQVII